MGIGDFGTQEMGVVIGKNGEPANKDRVHP